MGSVSRRRRPPMPVVWLVRYPARVATAVLGVVLAVVLLVWGANHASEPQNEPSPTATTQEGNPQQQCAAAAGRFARAYFDRDAPRPEWMQAMRDTTTPDIGRVVGTIDRDKIPAWTPKDVEVVTQEGSCDAKVTFAEGDASTMLLDVEPALGGWRVADWGQS